MSYHTVNGLGIEISGGAGVSIGPGGVQVTPPSVSVSTSTPTPSPSTSGGGGWSPTELVANAIARAMSVTLMPQFLKQIQALQAQAAPYPGVLNQVNALMTQYNYNLSTPDQASLQDLGNQIVDMTKRMPLLISNAKATAVAEAAAKVAAAKAAAAKADAAQKAAAKAKLASAQATSVTKPPMSTGKKFVFGAGVLGTLAAIWYVLAGSGAAVAAAAIPNRRRRHAGRLEMVHGRSHELPSRMADRKRIYRYELQHGSSVSQALHEAGLQYVQHVIRPKRRRRAA